MEIGQIIAERQLDGPHGEAIIVSIGLPRAFDDDSGWYCPYVIRHNHNERLRYAGGVDAVQALQLAMDHIGANLYALQRRLGGQITWNGSTELGFPDPGATSADPA